MELAGSGSGSRVGSRLMFALSVASGLARRETTGDNLVDGHLGGLGSSGGAWDESAVENRLLGVSLWSRIRWKASKLLAALAAWGP